MKGSADLKEDRALRNAARASFKANAAQVHADLAARGVGGRIVDATMDRARAAAGHAAAVANENRGVVVATLGALVLWIVRKPIVKLFDREQGDGD